MKKNKTDFNKTYRELGISKEPLSPNYSPDEYGWSLLHKTPQTNSVSYSDHTEITATAKRK